MGPKQARHTPTPWAVDGPAYAVVIGPDRKDVALTETGGARNTEEDAANAALIVRAANAHEALLEAAERAARYLQDRSAANTIGGTGKRALAALRAAIAQARGATP